MSRGVLAEAPVGCQEEPQITQISEFDLCNLWIESGGSEAKCHADVDLEIVAEATADEHRLV